jgi:hypothetical protein
MMRAVGCLLALVSAGFGARFGFRGCGGWRRSAVRFAGAGSVVIRSSSSTAIPSAPASATESS